MRIRSTLLLAVAALTGSVAADPASGTARLEQRIAALNLRDETLGEAVRLVGTVNGMPIICTPQAAGVRVSCHFTQIPLQTALLALCRAHDLWLNVSPEGVVIISTIQQQAASQSLYAADYVETVTVKYPSVYDVGDTLKGLFRDRIVWVRPDDDSYNPLERMETAMERMDLLSARSQLGSLESSSSSSSSTTSTSSYSGSSASSGRYRTTSSGSTRSGSSGTAGDYSSGDDTQQLEALAKNRAAASRQLQDRLALGVTGDAAASSLVYVSALPEINTMLVRSSDRDAVQAVKRAIADMDKPRGQVLLKVTVLAVSLDDSSQSGVEWLASKVQGGDTYSGGFATSSIGTLAGDAGTFTGGTPVFSFVSSDARIRATLLAESSKVRQLANPTLLVADNEAANVFVGKNAQFLDQITPGETVTTDGVVTTTSATPTFQTRNIGLSLLITPRVHADRTVTLRILQERSEADPTLRTINYGTGLNVQVQDIEQAVVVSTLVARDRSTVVLGGLVQESTTRSDSGVPLLKDVPLLGRLFSKKENATTKTELIVLLQPYVLAIPGEEQDASAGVLEQLGVDPAIARRPSPAKPGR